MASAFGLWTAAQRGDAEGLASLLARGAPVDGRDAQGFNAAMIAAKNGRARCLEVLAEGGTRLDAVDIAGSSALMHAARGGHGDCVALLIRKGADPLLKDASGWSAAAMASFHGRDGCLDLLLGLGAVEDLELVASLALEADRAPCFRSALKAGLDIDVRDEFGSWPWAEMAVKNASPACLAVMLSLGASLSAEWRAWDLENVARLAQAVLEIGERDGESARLCVDMISAEKERRALQKHIAGAKAERGRGAMRV